MDVPSAILLVTKKDLRPVVGYQQYARFASVDIHHHWCHAAQH